MDASFPDDVPLEAKMVSKAIERAQGTVEDRNFEIRKDVLKYDEVMNEQRKVIYRRRQQILDGEDLGDEAVAAIESAIEPSGRAVLPRRVLRGLGRSTGCSTRRALVLPDAHHQGADRRGDRRAKRSRPCSSTTPTRSTRRRPSPIGEETLRDIERRVMLSVIDQHWREHLYEMDYLQEGINLRAMGQQDPLSEWQREGFDMFEAMMGQIEDDFVRYVFHLQVSGRRGARGPTIRNVSVQRAEDPVQGSSSIEAAMAAQAARDAAGVRRRR